MPELRGKVRHNPGKHRKHTPVVSRRQQRMFGAELGRRKKGKRGRTGMSKAVLTKHLKESRGKFGSPLAKAVKEKHGR